MKAPTYDPQSGAFVSARTGRPILPGRTKNGYTLVTVNGRRVYAHRFAWFVVYGRWPTGDIDHINGDRSDNRIANLREATRSQNIGRADKREGRYGRGVNRHPDPRRARPYGAQITHQRRYIHLGWFATANEAQAAYRAAAAQLRGEFAARPSEIGGAP